MKKQIKMELVYKGKCIHYCCLKINLNGKQISKVEDRYNKQTTGATSLKHGMFQTQNANRY